MVRMNQHADLTTPKVLIMSVIDRIIWRYFIFTASLTGINPLFRPHVENFSEHLSNSTPGINSRCACFICHGITWEQDTSGHEAACQSFALSLLSL